ncbi:hypothetical protein N185_08515 [Sinorhizobium sp. GW3]|nr:hypothetical protein N185_08515 [Sinorhizobium sp. GW3]
MESVKRQSFHTVNHVIIDGMSNDRTVEIAREYFPGYLRSEKDAGIYHAMDKGAQAANGDILIFLNAGDTFFDDNVCSDIVDVFNETGADIVFGDILPVYLDPLDHHDHPAFRPGQLISLEYMRSRKNLHDESIHHQATFYRSSIFAHSRYGCERPEATGEYNLLLSAVFRHNAIVKYTPRAISRFQLGGRSTSNFEEEYNRYLAAVRALKELYLNQEAGKTDFDENEFHT